MSIGNGGKAFPSGSSGGMSLRDYFAAKAMQGLCADPTTVGTRVKDIAEECYKIADAMLAARGDV